MKVKTSKLTGAALDWAVEYIERGCEERPALRGYNYDVEWRNYRTARYSTDWAEGGPIIEREKLDLKYLPYDRPPYWGALKSNTAACARSGQIGPTALIAAMRCFVASKLGDKVDVPEELLEHV